MSTDLDLRPEIETIPETDDSKHSHIVERDPNGRSAHEVVLEARVNGTPVTALCGYVWVPHRDPEQLPLCSKCEEIMKFILELRA